MLPMWTSLHHSTASLHLSSCSYFVFLTQQALSAREESSRAFAFKTSFTSTLRKYGLSTQHHSTTMRWCATDAHDLYNPCQRRWMCNSKILTFPARFSFFRHVGQRRLCGRAIGMGTNWWKQGETAVKSVQQTLSNIVARVIVRFDDIGELEWRLEALCINPTRILLPPLAYFWEELGLLLSLLHLNMSMQRWTKIDVLSDFISKPCH